MKTLTVRLKPTENQVKLFKHYIECYDYVYNEALKINDKKASEISKEIREKIVKKGRCEKYDDMNYNIKDEALRQFLHAKSQFGDKLKNNRKGNSFVIYSCDMHFISKTEFNFTPKALKDFGLTGNDLIFRLYHKNEVLPDKLCKELEETDEEGEKIKKEKKKIPYKIKRIGRKWLLDILLYSTVKTEEIEKLPERKELLSIDPGLKTFITGYDCSDIIEIGNYKFLDKLKMLKNKISFFQHCISQKDIEYKTKKNMTRKIDIYYNKIKNIMKDFHHHTAKKLCMNYEKIFIPDFGGRSLYSRVGRKLPGESIKDLSMWSHCAFREILKNKAYEYNVKVFEVKEDYTSKTCSCCGWLNNDLGGNRTFECKECKVVYDRDHNASKNILLKNIHLLV